MPPTIQEIGKVLMTARKQKVVYRKAGR